jgi:hypothetical protein
VRWVGWGCEADARVWADQRLRDAESQFWLGDDLIVCAVADELAVAVDVYLPLRNADAGTDPRPGYVLLAGAFPRYAAGQWVRVSCPLAAGAPVFAREGSALPVGRDERTAAPGDDEDDAADDSTSDEAGPAVRLPRDDYRAVELYPPGGAWGGRWFATVWHEDDGVSVSATATLECRVAYRCAADRIELRYDERGGAGGGGFAPAWTELVVVLPPGETRRVVAAEAAPDVCEAALEPDGRPRYVVAVKRDLVVRSDGPGPDSV